MSNRFISRFFSRTIFNFSLRRHPFKYRALDVLLGLRAPRRVQRKEKKSQHVFLQQNNRPSTTLLRFPYRRSRIKTRQISTFYVARHAKSFVNHRPGIIVRRFRSVYLLCTVDGKTSVNRKINTTVKKNRTGTIFIFHHSIMGVKYFTKTIVQPGAH